MTPDITTYRQFCALPLNEKEARLRSLEQWIARYGVTRRSMPRRHAIAWAWWQGDPSLLPEHYR